MDQLTYHDSLIKPSVAPGEVNPCFAGKSRQWARIKMTVDDPASLERYFSADPDRDAPFSPGKSPFAADSKDRAKHSFPDLLLAGFARSAAVLVLVMLVALLGVLSYAAIPGIKSFGLHFLFSSEWRPNSIDQPKSARMGWW